ncbi:hypothetical protein CR513_32936, partial [Mucuna pruriens]
MEALEQRNEELRSELAQIKEQMAKVLEFLAREPPQTQNTPNYPPGYTPPPPWNTQEEQPQPNENNLNGPTPGVGPQGPNGPTIMTPAQTQKDHPEVDERWRFLEERLRIVEGTDKYGLDAADLCLVPDVVLPTDFKTPDFDKYKGSSCPRTHLAMYCRKMAAHIQDDKILVHCFQDSLSGAALSWYVNLERGRVRTWKDLAEAFLKQYRYNEDMAPDRSRLQNMAKKDHEGFKEYAQKWRELAAQVQPPLAEKEMVSTFIDTLPTPYYEIIVGSVSSNFADLVIIGERIEAGLKRGKFASAMGQASYAKKVTQEKRKAEANAVIANTTAGYGQAKPLHIQVKEKLGADLPTPLYLPADTAGTSAATGTKPPIRRNTPRTLDPVPIPYPELLKSLLEKKLITIVPLKPVEPPYSKSYDPNSRCEYHRGVTGHATERCWGLKHKVQDLIDEGWLVFQKKGPNVTINPLPEHGTINFIEHNAAIRKTVTSDPHRIPHEAEKVEEGTHQGRMLPAQVNTIGEGKIPQLKPLIICYDEVAQAKLPLVILVPGPQYTNTHAIPWKYPEEKANPDSQITNIAGTSGVTRSGRVYAPEELWRKDDSYNRKKGKIGELSKPPEEKETDEFLKFIRHSEYEMMDQLNKTPARISLLALLANSEGHRQLLLKTLKEAHVAKDISTEKFEGIVGNLTAANHISFFEEELPKEGSSHNLPLHVAVKCGEYMMARVLIDNGSSLNVMPKSTLNKLCSTEASLRASPIIVRAFDGSKREVMGEITLPIRMGPTTFEVDFQVMDINPVYSCLLGRPWIHKAGAVPSSLHQKVKFVSEHMLISVKGEEDLVISTPAPVEYVEGGEDALETSFQSLEIAETGHEQEKREFSSVALSILKKAGYQPGKGLGKLLEGVSEPIVLLENPGRAGFGFFNQSCSEPKKITKGAAQLYQRFISGGMIVPDQESNTLLAPALQITPLSNDNTTLETDERGSPDHLDPNLHNETSALGESKGEPEIHDRVQAPEGSTETINIGKGGTLKEVRIGKNLCSDMKRQMVELLEEYSDVFAWSYQDMPGLDTNIVEHRLPIKPGAAGEVEKQWKAGFLAVSEYPQWVANIVPVPKKDGKVRMCVDYRDLNKASPKDNFPLPHIDTLVDNTACHQIFSFMDGFSGYNQIRMAPEDREKTTFTTAWGTFCYQVMPFGLKNAGPLTKGPW